MECVCVCEAEGELIVRTSVLKIRCSLSPSPVLKGISSTRAVCLLHQRVSHKVRGLLVHGLFVPPATK